MQGKSAIRKKCLFALLRAQMPLERYVRVPLSFVLFTVAARRTEVFTHLSATIGLFESNRLTEKEMWGALSAAGRPHFV